MSYKTLKDAVVVARVSHAVIAIAFICNHLLLFSSKVWVNQLLFTGSQKHIQAQQRCA